MSGNGVTGLPARPGSLTSSPVVRLRKVHTLSDLLPSMDVTITPSDDGKLNATLPAEVGELFLLDPEQRAKEWQEATHKGRLQEIERNAELQAMSGEALRECQAEQDAWAEEYEKLRAQGMGHRQALNSIRGPKEVRDSITVTDVELGIQEALGRRRRQHREARNAEIIRLVGEGRSLQAISDALAIPYQTVRSAVRAARVPVRDARHDRRGAMGAIPAHGQRQGNGHAQLTRS